MPNPTRKPVLPLLLLTLALGGCSTVPSSDEALPPYMARVDWYEAQYIADPANREDQQWSDYLLWAQRFYEGSYLYSRGWTDTVDDVLAALPPATPTEEVRRRMVDLGQRISAEWAKENEHRVITTRHMSIWGDALREALAREEIPVLLSRVEADVEDLLDGDLGQGDIQPDRYYVVELDEHDPFAF